MEQKDLITIDGMSKSIVVDGFEEALNAKLAQYQSTKQPTNAEIMAQLEQLKENNNG